MSAKIIDGKKLSQEILDNAKLEVLEFKKKGIVPGLAAVMVGSNPASEIYVRKKHEACETVGMHSRKVNLPPTISQVELEAVVDELNADKKINGIIVQLPLPQHINEKKVIQKILPEKDVDGFTLKNLAKLFVGKEFLAPATPKGCIKLIESTGIEIKGKNCVVIGRSMTVGKPLAIMLLNRDGTISCCHRETKNLAEFTKTADILCVAVGKPNLVAKGMVKKGAIVIDVGINRLENGKIVGDVSNDVFDIAGWITPVPGGVGPMTVSCLIDNTIVATKKQLEKGMI